MDPMSPLMTVAQYDRRPTQTEPTFRKTPQLAKQKKKEQNKPRQTAGMHAVRGESKEREEGAGDQTGN